jgi:phage shock protein PspC (stress-responsive transcriptional regulator)
MPEYSSYEPVPSRKRLVRRTDNRIVAGVCSGVAAYAGIDVALVRILLVAAVVLGLGSGIIIYALAWLLLPAA